jgi:hypothetical protein
VLVCVVVYGVVRVDTVSEQRFVRNATLAGMCLTHFVS